MKSQGNNYRFENFYSQFKKLGIIRDLEESVDLWSYNQLDEVNRIAPLIKSKMTTNINYQTVCTHNAIRIAFRFVLGERKTCLL